jgi:hypothetical protein
MMQWENVTTDGMIQRLKIDGGWLYQNFRAVLNHNELWDYEPVGLCFVPDNAAKNQRSGAESGDSVG